MNINKAAILVLIIFASINLSAQEKTKDVLYFKNGNIIRGELVSIDSAGNFLIKSVDGDSLIFDFEIIEKVKMGYHDSKKIPKDFTPKIAKLNHTFNIGFLVGRNNNYYYNYKVFNYNFSFSYALKYTVFPFFSIGIGTGIDEYNELPLVPLTGEATLSRSHGRMVPFIDLFYGRSFYWLGGETKEYSSYYRIEREGGQLLGCNLGIKYFTHPDIALTFSIGYKNQMAITTDIYDTQTIKRIYRYSRISYRLGLLF